MHKLLNRDGSMREIDVDWLATATVIGTDELPETPYLHTFDRSSTKALVIAFDSGSDGRGFSMIAELRECNGYERTVYASGALIPDQVSLAFQCGFDGVIVTRQQFDLYGEESWRVALTPLVNNGYVESNWSTIESIWTRRLAARS